MSIGQQLRVATRQWARQPRLAATAVLTLALGIGGATTMYGFLSRTTDGGLAALSERAWRARFGADPGVLGRSLDLDGRGYTVVGVVAERLGLVMGLTDVFVPLVETDGGRAVRVIARRRTHSSWEQVRADMRTVGLADEKTQLRVREGTPWILMLLLEGFNPPKVRQ